MNQFMIASAVDFPAMQTYGLTGCIAVFIYDSEMRLGALTHVSAPTDIPTSMKRIFDRFKYMGGNFKTTTATLIGGWSKSTDSFSASPAMLKKIKKALAGKKIKIAKEETLFNENVIRNVEIDLWDGRVYEYKESVPYIKRDRIDPSWIQKYEQKKILQPHLESL
ncbi:MAG: hypothetical protein AB7O96_03935 [Pseudobdellovibrionaceae bacterium]